MKPIYFLLLVIFPFTSFAQWTTSGSNIFSSNTGNVGIGNSSPDRKLYVRGIFSSFNAVSTFELQNSSGSETVAASFYMYPASTTSINYLKNTAMLYMGGTTGLHLNVANPKSGGAIRFHTGGFDSESTQRLIIAANGNIGIGQPSPAFKLDVNGIINATGLNINGVPFSGSSQWITSGSNINFNTGNVGIGTTSPAYKLDVGGVVNASGIYINGAPFAGGGSQWTSASSNIYFSTGNVGIGTTAPDAKLAVKGTIHAQEVKVDLNVPGPDYVFNDDYKLLSLAEIKTYIDQHKHLPEIPSAKEMEANGVNLGEMNMLLLKKIEELTLYLIELKEENKKQNEEIVELRNQKR